MTPANVLNADMGTVARWLRTGFDWWIGELSELVPDRVRRLGKPRGPTLDFDGQALGLVRDGVHAPLTPGGGPYRHATILLPRHLTLRRSILTPVMSGNDLARTLALDGDRYLPLPPDAALIASSITGREDGKLRAEIAALPLPVAEAVAQAIGKEQASPARILLADDKGRPDARFDFLPAMRDAGVIATARGAAAGWWLLVGFLFLLNLALLVWRDVAELNQLQALVDAQQPSVAAAQRIVRQVQQADAVVRRAAARREGRDAIGVLAATSAAMPDGAWIQRYSWEGDGLRLTGYKPRDVNVVATLRRNPFFANVRSAQTDSLAEIAFGQPFEITARIGGN